MSLKAKIESVLFLTEKPMRAQAIARIVNEDVQKVRQMILELINDYDERESGLEIADDNGYIIQVKDQYSSIIDEFVPMEMPIALVRTLSAIAIKQPVAQSEIIKIRGAGAYDHIKELVEKELIVKREDGRSPTLSTTKKFQEYFRLSHDAKSLRHELRKEDRQQSQEEQEGQSLLSGQLSLELTTSEIQVPEALDASATESGDVSHIDDAQSGNVADIDEGQSSDASDIDEAKSSHAVASSEDSGASGAEFDASPDRQPRIDIAADTFDASPAADVVDKPADDQANRGPAIDGAAISLDELTNRS